MRIANFFPGRFNPPTIKHQEIIEKMISYDGDSYLFIVDGENTSKIKLITLFHMKTDIIFLKLIIQT